MKSTLGRALDTVPELRGRLSEHLTVADSDDQFTEGGFTIFFRLEVDRKLVAGGACDRGKCLNHVVSMFLFISDFKFTPRLSKENNLGHVHTSPCDIK